MMKNPELFPEWKTEVPVIFDWVYAKLGNDIWKNYGVTVVNDQTAYSVEGNSHSARQASVELLYEKLTGETSRIENVERRLNWATYMVYFDGINQYPNEQIWTSDGYVNYVRHFLRAMDARPELSPDNANHLLSSTSKIKRIENYPNYAYGIWSIAFSESELKKGKDIFPKVRYFTYDKTSKEVVIKIVAELSDLLDINTEMLIDKIITDNKRLLLLSPHPITQINVQVFGL